MARSSAGPLRSLVDQEFRDFEIIVIDNHSEGNATERAVIEMSDPRIRYIRHATRVSMGENWNRGLEEARCDYVGIYHDHDYHHPSMVSEAVPAGQRSRSDVGDVELPAVALDPRERLVLAWRIHVGQPDD